MKSFKLSALAAASLTLVATSPLTQAHTTVFDPIGTDLVGNVTGLTSSNNGIYFNTNSMAYLSVSHGCAEERTGDHLDVVANAVALPHINPIWKKCVAGTSNCTEISAAEAIANFQATDHTGATSSWSGEPGDILRPVVPQGPFQKTQMFYDPNEPSRVLGWASTKAAPGIPGTSAVGLLPFKIANKPNVTASSCAKTLKIKIAIADVCKPNRWPVKGGAGIADLWIPRVTDKFSDASIDGVSALVSSTDATQGYKDPATLPGYPATLTFIRPTSNAVPSSCATAYDYVVYPSTSDVDSILPHAWNVKRATK